MGKWHLKVNPRIQNKKRYKYYDIAENYIDDAGKHQKRKIKYLGNLSEEKVASIKLVLRVLNGEELTLLNFNDLKFIDSKRYLDVALLSYLYDKLKLNEVFNVISDKEVGLAEVARILIICRCLDPQANYLTVDWVKNSYLPQIMGINSEKYNKDKLFRELVPILERKKNLQKHFIKLSRSFNIGQSELYFFDATTSYFEGSCCEMAKPGMEKTRVFESKVVLIGLVTDKKGFPIAWDVFSGDRKEIKEFKVIAKQLADDLGIKEATFCFDRGIASISNFELIEDLEGLNSKFISGLDRNQISKVFDLDSFQLTTRNLLIEKHSIPIPREPAPKRSIPINGFYRLGMDRFYKDLGVKEKKRYVVSFNVNIYEKEKKLRIDAIDTCKQEIETINHDLANAKGDREDSPVEKKIEALLKKHQLIKIIDYNIIPIAASNNHVQTYRVEYQINDKELKEKEKHDGILIYITNHIEMSKGCFEVTAGEIVRHYKDKYVIENAFRHLKSVLDLRPFYVRIDDHIKAHVTICMASYFIDTYIQQVLNAAELDFSLRDFYNLLNADSIVCKLETPTGPSDALLKIPSRELMQIIQSFDALSILSKEVLSKLKIKKS